MTITGGSALPKEEIDRMVKQAEEHAAEDKKRREELEMRNMAETAVYSTEKLLKDNADKIADETAKEVQGAVDAVKEALEGEDTDALEKALADLNEKGMKIGEEIYKAAAEEEAELPSQQEVNEEEEVIDAVIVEDED